MHEVMLAVGVDGQNHFIADSRSPVAVRTALA
jgi:hypothetical protein